MVNKAVNSGTDAQTGFALQRNTALYLLLEEYFVKFKGRKYFICLEHHDDFLFCFLNEKDEALSIEAYQSKKKSPDRWSLNEEMYEIISKLLKTGKELLIDSFPKIKGCKNLLFFTSNQTISFEYKIPGISKSATQTVKIKIKEDAHLVKYVNLHQEIKTKITNGVTDILLHSELDNLHFLWIDLNRTVSKQENELVGQLESVFKKKIIDHRAAVNCLISLFREIEVIYNQGNIAKLLDVTKRVSSDQIEDAFKILTTKSKAFEEWRNEKREISDALGIKYSLRDTFEQKFNLAFDLFKSLTEAEHQKILKFVKDNFGKCNEIHLGDIVVELHDLFLKENICQFDTLDLMAIIYAAYFEATFKH